MSKISGHLIVISPSLGRAWKTHFNRTTLLVLVFAFAVSFLGVAIFGYTFPPLVNDADWRRLQSENTKLRVENKDLGFQIGKLNSTLDRIEEMSHDVSTQLEGD